jgi:hypothetical protein
MVEAAPGVKATNLGLSIGYGRLEDVTGMVK